MIVYDWFITDGKTVTTRQVETVSKSAGVGGTSFGKPAGKNCVYCVTYTKVEISKMSLFMRKWALWFQTS